MENWVDRVAGARRPDPTSWHSAVLRLSGKARELQLHRQTPMGQSSRGRSVIRPTGARYVAEPPPRAEYVRHQQRLAYHAVCLGFVGAARAALLGLSPDDYLDGRSAGEYFEVLRDRSAPADDVLVAIHRLISLAPVLPEDTGPFVARLDPGRDRNPKRSDKWGSPSPQWEGVRLKSRTHVVHRALDSGRRLEERVRCEDDTSLEEAFLGDHHGGFAKR